jgi:sodium-dependent phosphate cotransporter
LILHIFSQLVGIAGTQIKVVKLHHLKRILFLLILLYIFLVSISLLGKSFGLFGKDAAHGLLASVQSPAVGLFVGILATALIQSSSTTTSIVVGLVGSGMVPVSVAIPVIMGANVGTSITNILVSLGHISRSVEFKRAFAAANVHDMFNLCAVAIIFPLQISTGYLETVASAASSVFNSAGGLEFSSPIKALTTPVVHALVGATGHSGILTLLLGLLLLFFALKYIVTIMKSFVLHRVEEFFSRYIFRTTVRAFVLGTILTSIVQSSSITTSLVVPLAGAGVLTIEQIYPYTLGANIGTTITAMMAALATGSIPAVTVAFSHLAFNISGTVIFLPLRRIPIFLAKKLTVYAVRSKLIPFAYLAVVFFLLPLLLIFVMRG